MIKIGTFHCKDCGNAPEIHPFDLFPSRYSGWQVSCEHCGRGASLPLVPTVPAFLVGFVTCLYLAAPVTNLAEQMFGNPLPFAVFLSVVVAVLVAGVASIVAANALYYRVFA